MAKIPYATPLFGDNTKNFALFKKKITKVSIVL